MRPEEVRLKIPGDILPVCFIHNQDDILRKLLQKIVHVRRGNACPSRIIRVAKKDQLGPSGHRLQHSGQIVSKILEGDLSDVASHRLTDAPIHDKGRMAHDGFIPWSQKGPGD